MSYLLQHLLDLTAERLPRQVALCQGAARVTYAELDAAANRIARALGAAGVRRGDRVAIWLDKSPATVAGIFGILRAGAAYVPLDPGAPPKRLGYLLRDCAVRVLWTAAARLPGVESLCVEGAPLTTALLCDDPAAADAGAGRVRCVPGSAVDALDGGPLPPPGTTENDLAYILYTSGSTGDPKGVMISHRASLTFVEWAAATFALGPQDRVTSHAPIHFDLSTFDLFASILAGATVVLVPPECSVFPVRLVRLLQDERITVTYLVPSAMALARAYGDLPGHDLGTLRHVLFAGEVCPLDTLRAWVAAAPHAAFHNLYGPTETNACTFHRVRPEDLAPERTEGVPIGVACANSEVFAVDDDGKLVDRPGVRGELWVRGPGLAHGYWGDPARTAERFVPNRFQPHFAEKAYRTGDDVYLDATGERWIYAGRRDRMVKSRGHRIELGDVEQALETHPDVEQAAVVTVPDPLIGARLRAFCLAAVARRPTVAALERHCRERLPDYMLPESIEVLDAFPRTSTGKLDRRALADRPALSGRGGGEG